VNQLVARVPPRDGARLLADKLLDEEEFEQRVWGMVERTRAQRDRN
jgi:hypothetical protein